MLSNNNLSSMCRIAQDANDYVGVISGDDNINVVFPVGYRLSDSNEEVRKDILQFILVLSSFKDKIDDSIDIKKESRDEINFPINAYLEVLDYYLTHSYYIERDPVYVTKDAGKINWNKTIKKQTPLFDDSDDIFYTKFTVRYNSPDEKKIITDINKICVYESFIKIGWLYTSFIPQKPDTYDFLRKNDDVRFYYLQTLKNKLHSSNKDVDKRLFIAMISIISNIGHGTSNKISYYGTYKFEKIWECLVDSLFGNEINKNKFFPSVSWNIYHNKTQSRDHLYPDTIMHDRDRVFILDAKYYRFGVTGDTKHLPDSSSINKQVVYGEYAYNMVCNSENEVYNAFIMPYNKTNNTFGLDTSIGVIGDVYVDWKNNPFKHKYERIVGVVIDSKDLITNYKNDKIEKIHELSHLIEDALSNIISKN